ncbi:MAG: PTS sugar transporter subunit IIA [Planctomycetota bacterium]
MQLLRNTFANDAVILDLEAHSLASIFREATTRLAASGALKPGTAEQVEAALAERETKASTAIGHAVAVPHAYLDAVNEPTVVFVRLRHPLNLGAPDGIPTRFVFFLLGPANAAPQHLDILASIARLMADDEFRYDARQARSGDDLTEALDRFAMRTAPKPAKQIEQPDSTPEGLGVSQGFLSGIRADISRRAQSYTSDFRDGVHPKCLATVVFLFFACIAPAIIFGGVMAKGTGGVIGPVEMIVATAICGVVYSLAAGQPLIILGSTGPLLIFTILLHQLCKDQGIDFLPAYAWVGLWSALFTVLLAVTDASRWIRYFTRFTDEIFSALISIIFIYEAGRQLWTPFGGPENGANYEAALFALLLALGTFYIAMSLSQIRRSSFLLPWMREFLADFGPTIAMVAMVAVAMGMSQVPIDRLPVPEEFGTSTGRGWLVDMGSAPTWVKFAAAGPAVLVTILIYLDQNITSRLVNSPDHKLQKGPGYHLDLAVVGLLVGFCSMLGLPWLVAATVRSLNHVRSLATVEEVVGPGGETSSKICHVRENRVTNLAIHLLIGASLLLLPLLEIVPMAVLYGLFLFMGVVSIAGNQFFERMGLWLKDPDLYPVTHYIRRAPIKTIHLFTGIQLACLAMLWMIKTADDSRIAILFPLFVVLLAPVRYASGLWFKREHLAALDTDEEPDEEKTHWSR